MNDFCKVCPNHERCDVSNDCMGLDPSDMAKRGMIRPFTGDPLSACCGSPDACSQPHLYCFNRPTKEANTEAMSMFADVTGPQPDRLETPEQRKAFDLSFDATREAVRKTMIEEAQEALSLSDAHDRAQKRMQAVINGATHGSTPASQTPIEKATCGGVFPPLPTWAKEVLADAEKAIEQEHHLPTDSKARKETPICTGVLDYFPKALAEIARLSKAGNDKHNPGQPLHWAREKSTDHADCIIRHMLERGTIDEFGFLHEVSVAWRALAQLEVALERKA